MSATDAAEAKTATWPIELYDLLRRNGVTQFA
jgi:hypothetical protein